MSLSPTPTIYFSGINYNPSFYQKPSGVSLTYVSQNYLQRLGLNPTSIATNTTFQGNITSGNINSSGVLTITNTTPSFYPTSGCAIFSGGVGIVGNLNMDGKFQTQGNFISTNITPSIGIGDGCATFAGGVGIGGNTNIAGNIKIYNNLVSSGSGSGSFQTDGGIYVARSSVFDTNAVVSFKNTTESTDYTNGSLVLSGGIGVGKSIRANGNILSNGYMQSHGIIYALNSSISTDGGTGSLQCSGGIYVARDSVFGSGATVKFQTNKDAIAYDNAGITITGGLGVQKSIYTNGNINISGDLYAKNETIINDGAVVENFAVSGSFVVGGKISSGSQISCVSLLANDIISTGDISHENKIGGFLYSTVFPYSFPLTRTNPDITFTFGINLRTMLSTSSSVFLQVGYKIVFVDYANAVIAKIDNTNGKNPLYQVLPSPNGYADYDSCLGIFMFYNNMQVSYADYS